ncbi:MAG TPA: DUF554 domain-containing protein [Anaerolineae bacterium]|nr:DUF554 domain-containing protein [Anaerolineae bacterium]
MTGTIINITTVIIGGILGLFFGARFPDKMRKTVVAGLGLFTGAIGLSMFMDSKNQIVVLISLLIGGILGEWWKLETRLSNLGLILEKRFGSLEPNENPKEKNQTNTNFVKGFLAASLLFCVGPMTVLGSIQDGLTGDYQLLAIKSIMDGFASMAFASTLGIGVLFSVIVIFIYQGGLTLLASLAQMYFTPEMMNELTAVGGIILIGLAISSLLEIKKIRAGNFLPALVIAPLIIAILSNFG